MTEAKAHASSRDRIHAPAPRHGAAIHYMRDAYTAPKQVIFGRLRANMGFFGACLRHGTASQLHCFAPSREDAQDLVRRLEAEGPLPKPVTWIPGTRIEAVGRCGTLQVYSPRLGFWAWARRSRRCDADFSLCGVTHSLSGPVAAQWLTDYVTAPLEPWDALICTSEAARQMVADSLALYRDWLGHRLGVAVPPATVVQLPVIPLGIDVAACQAPDPAAARAAWRGRLGLGDGEVVALYLGRLSTGNKLNPYPLFRALQLASEQGGPPLACILAGIFDGPASEAGWREAAARLAPAVRCLFVDGLTLEHEPPLWPAADFFVSLADNIQETFGLAPVEAMAAGLPAVVSDWDGYRDTVTEGETGFRVPTLLPPRGAGLDLARASFEAGMPEATHNDYVGEIAQLTAIDIGATARAIGRLTANPDLRRDMGRQAATAARRRFDWPVVIAQYEALWQELGRIRARMAGANRLRHAEFHPLYPDPCGLYQPYATRSFALHDLVRATGTPLQEVRTLRVAQPGAAHRLAEAEQAALFDRIAAGALSVQETIEPFGQAQAPAALRTLAWMAKFGLIEIG